MLIMKKTELVKEIAVKAEVSRKDAEKVLDSVVETIREEVKNNGEIRVNGIWTFKKTERKARNARNPKTGETIKVPAKNAVSVKISKDFKELVNS